LGWFSTTFLIKLKLFNSQEFVLSARHKAVKFACSK